MVVPPVRNLNARACVCTLSLSLSLFAPLYYTLLPSFLSCSTLRALNRTTLRAVFFAEVLSGWRAHDSSARKVARSGTIRRSELPNRKGLLIFRCAGSLAWQRDRPWAPPSPLPRGPSPPPTRSSSISLLQAHYSMDQWCSNIRHWCFVKFL